MSFKARIDKRTIQIEKSECAPQLPHPIHKRQIAFGAPSTGSDIEGSENLVRNTQAKLNTLQLWEDTERAFE